MAKFLIRASYTTEGARGLLKDGGSKRRAAVDATVKAVGGRLEAFYFAFGDTDAYVIVDGVDALTAAAVALTVGASGAVRQSTTLLLTPEEVDQACAKSVSYRAPGQA